VTDVDPVLVAALREQLGRRSADGHRVGWKVGRGDRERIGDGIAVGHLTSATLLESGSTYRDGSGLHADAEITLRISEDFSETVRSVARVVGAVGEVLRRGDRIITGSVVQVAVSSGDDVVADFGSLGRVAVSIA
jgi:hypothetical protein